MKEKIRVAFIYRDSYEFITGNCFNNTFYHFFMDALKRNEDIDVTYYPSSDKFDVSRLKNTDVILIFGAHPNSTPELVGIRNSGIPVISTTGDAHDAKHTNKVGFHRSYKVDCYFGFMPEEYFYRFCPDDFNYKTIVFGLEPSLYQNLKPFGERIKDRILNSGAIVDPRLRVKLYHKIRHPESDPSRHYKLRTMCNRLPYVDYTPRTQHEYVNDRYPCLLSKYAASIAATTSFPTIKYWEIPAAGCLTFMEITETNNGKFLGFEDGKTAVFINEDNYEERFEEYLADPEDEKWERIAESGREHVMNNLSNDVAVRRLVELMREYGSK